TRLQARLMVVSITGSILGGIDSPGVDLLPAIVLQQTIKAGFIALVAGRAVATLVDLQQNGVRVAIDAYFANGLIISRLLALAPETCARARVIARAPGANRLSQRLAVHIGEHQHPSTGIVL